MRDPCLSAGSCVEARLGLTETHRGSGRDLNFRARSSLQTFRPSPSWDPPSPSPRLQHASRVENLADKERIQHRGQLPRGAVARRMGTREATPRQFRSLSGSDAFRETMGPDSKSCFLGTGCRVQEQCGVVEADEPGSLGMAVR